MLANRSPRAVTGRGSAKRPDAGRMGDMRCDPRLAGMAEASDTPITVQPGWTGRFFEDFAVGDRYEHALGRTVLDVDNSWFTLLTQNTAPIHFDAHYASQTEWGRPLVDSTFTLALVTGQSVTDVSQHVFANLGWDEVRLPAPVFEGDTIYSQSTVLQTRESASHPDTGLVRVQTVGYNQDGTIVITFLRSLLVFRRGHGPAP